MATAALRLRRAVATLTGELGTDLMVVWRAVDKAADAGTALHDILPALIEQYGLAAGALAAEWYDEQRAKAAVRGSFTAIPADIPDVGAHALVGWAEATATDYSAFQTLILGGAQRRVANFARQTVTTSSMQDPGARGWQRVGVGECDFCSMLIGRGAVYTEATADFQSHDHCHCYAEPAF